MSGRRRRRIGPILGLGVLSALGMAGCRQMHQRQVFYPNGDGRRLVEARPGRLAGTAKAPAAPKTPWRPGEFPTMLLGH